MSGTATADMPTAMAEAEAEQHQHQEEQKTLRGYEMLPIAQLNRPYVRPVCLSAEIQTLSSLTLPIDGDGRSLDKMWRKLRFIMPVVGADGAPPFSAQISALNLVHYQCSSEDAHVVLRFDKPVLQVGACNSLPATPITLELPPGYYNGALPVQLYRNDDFLRLSADEALRELRYSAYANKQQLLAEVEFDASGRLVRACERSALVDAWRHYASSKEHKGKELAQITQADAENLAAKAESEYMQRRRAPRVYPHELTGELHVQRGKDGVVPTCVVYMLFRVTIRELYAERTGAPPRP